MPIGGAARRLTNDRFVEMRSDLVAGRPLARVLVRSRRHDGSVGARHRERRRPEGRVRARPRRRGRRAATRSRTSPATARWRSPAAARRFTRRFAIRAGPTWAPEGLDRGHDAAAVLDAGFAKAPTSCCWCRRRAARRSAARIPSAHQSIGTRDERRAGVVARRLEDGVRDGRPACTSCRRRRPAMSPAAAAPSRHDIADSPSWAADSKRLLYQTATRPEARRRHRLKARVTDVPDQPDVAAGNSRGPHGRARRPPVRRHAPRRCAATSTS